MPRLIAACHAAFETPDLEQSILEPLGGSVVSRRSVADQHALVDLVRDADYIITQSAPINAQVIEGMQRVRTSFDLPEPHSSLQRVRLLDQQTTSLR